MSELFHALGEIDDRLRPLVFFIRRWAEECGITSSIQPSPCITNFMLSCLVVFFLQQLPKPILPPCEDFITHTVAFDHSTFSTDIAKLNFKSENTSTLEELAVEFFKYYSSFDYTKNAIDITSGKIKANINDESIHVINPLAQTVNVCKVVTDYERSRFIDKCRFSLDALTTLNFDLVRLFESFSNKSKNSKINSFVYNMTTGGVEKSKQTESKPKFDVRHMKYKGV